MTSIRSKARVCFLIHLQQDLDLLSPLILLMQENKIPHSCVVYKKIIKKSPRIKKFLESHKIPWIQCHLDRSFIRGVLEILKSTHIISAVETNTPGHKFGYYLTLIANTFFKKTFTFQHGIDNIGLTYSDKEYPIQNVSFASKTILLWSEVDSLHPLVNSKTLKKCIPLGCPKDFKSMTSHSFSANKSIKIGVFENLHWSRYSTEYKENFVHHFLKMANYFPQINFLLKPHHAGQWLTKRSMLNHQWPENVTIIDPSSTEWEPLTGPQIISSVDAVITSPSTIAFDAACLQKPVAIIAGDLEVTNYSPLLAIKDDKGWIGFVNNLIENSFSIPKEQSLFLDRFKLRHTIRERFVHLLDN